MRKRFWLTFAACAIASVWSAGSAVADDATISAGQLSTNEMIFLSSKLDGLNVFNRSDTTQKLGHLNDLVIDAHTGQVMYGILSAGLTGKNIPVPWNAFQLQEDVKNHKSWLTLSKTSDDLKNSPTFDKKHQPDFTDQQWKQTVDNFFGVRTVARPTK